MPSDPPAKRRVRWWLVLTLSVLFGFAAMLIAFLTVNASMDAVTTELGELRVSVFGVRLFNERGSRQPLEQKMFAYGWTLIGGYVALGMLLGAGIGATLTSSKAPAPNPPKP